MTDYEQLAADMTAAGLKGATVRTARDLAERSMYGLPMTILETAIVEAWVARRWKPAGRARSPPS